MKITSKTIIGSILMFIGLSIFFGGSLGGLIPTLIGAWLIYVGVKNMIKAVKQQGHSLYYRCIARRAVAAILLGIAFAGVLSTLAGR